MTKKGNIIESGEIESDIGNFSKIECTQLKKKSKKSKNYTSEQNEKETEFVNTLDKDYYQAPSEKDIETVKRKNGENRSPKKKRKKLNSTENSHMLGDNCNINKMCEEKDELSGFISQSLLGCLSNKSAGRDEQYASSNKSKQKLKESQSNPTAEKSSSNYDSEIVQPKHSKKMPHLSSSVMDNLLAKLDKMSQEEKELCESPIKLRKKNNSDEEKKEKIDTCSQSIQSKKKSHLPCLTDLALDNLLFKFNKIVREDEGKNQIARESLLKQAKEQEMKESKKKTELIDRDEQKDLSIDKDEMKAEVGEKSVSQKNMKGDKTGHKKQTCDSVEQKDASEEDQLKKSATKKKKKNKNSDMSNENDVEAHKQSFDNIEKDDYVSEEEQLKNIAPKKKKKNKNSDVSNENTLEAPENSENAVKMDFSSEFQLERIEVKKRKKRKHLDTSDENNIEEEITAPKKKRFTVEHTGKGSDSLDVDQLERIKVKKSKKKKEDKLNEEFQLKNDEMSTQDESIEKIETCSLSSRSGKISRLPCLSGAALDDLLFKFNKIVKEDEGKNSSTTKSALKKIKENKTKEKKIEPEDLSSEGNQEQPTAVKKESTNQDSFPSNEEVFEGSKKVSKQTKQCVENTISQDLFSQDQYKQTTFKEKKDKNSNLTEKNNTIDEKMGHKRAKHAVENTMSQDLFSQDDQFRQTAVKEKKNKKLNKSTKSDIGDEKIFLAHKKNKQYVENTMSQDLFCEDNQIIQNSVEEKKDENMNLSDKITIGDEKIAPKKSKKSVESSESENFSSKEDREEQTNANKSAKNRNLNLSNKSITRNKKLLAESSESEDISSDEDEFEPVIFKTTVKKESPIFLNEKGSSSSEFSESEDEKITETSTCIEELEEKLNEMTKYNSEKLEAIEFVVPMELPKIHHIVGGLRPPSIEQTNRLRRAGITLKLGKYTKEEDEKIRKNWKQFCRQHNWDEKDVQPFLIGSKKSKYGCISAKKFLKFVQYISHDFEDRLMYNIYARFQRLFAQLETRKFTRKEDKIIEDYVHKSGSKEPLADLAVLLKRTKVSIKKRYQKILDEKTLDTHRHKWNRASTKELLLHILEATGFKKISDLKDYAISAKEWKKISEKMNIPYLRLKRVWDHSLCLKVFHPNCDEELNEVRMLLIARLYRKYNDWREIDWKEEAKYFDSIPPTILHTLATNLVRFKVPKEERKNFKASLEYVLDHPCKRSKFKFKFISDLLEEIDAGI